MVPRKPCVLGIQIREQDPLKQGLKPIVWYGLKGTISIREQDPLKQGLKPELDEF